MSKRANQKLKLLYLYKIMVEQTDKTHGLSLPKIQEELKKKGIIVNRQALYDDFKALREFGADIQKTGNASKTRYYLANARFEPAELKILIDAVQASRFLTKKKTEDLIAKLTTANGNSDESLQNRQVYVAGRIKNMNDSIYENTDTIHTAIAENKMITYQYFSWNVHKEMELHHDGAFYEVSPWALFWDRDKYYMVAFDAKTKEIRHYRVDKMLNVSLVDKKRKGITAFSKVDKSTYTQKHFGMFGGEEMTVTLECPNTKANAVIDRFGKQVELIPLDNDTFRAEVDLIMSDKFLSWIIALGTGCKVVAPEAAVERMKKIAERMRRDYE